MKTTWKNIVGYEGLYQVSTDGRCRHKVSDKWNEIKGSKNEKGYIRIDLYKHGKRKSAVLSRLIMETFCPIKNSDKLQVNHKDGDKTNNALSNLEWCTSSENVRYAFDTGLKQPVYGEGHGMHKLTECEVREIKRMYVRGSREHGSNALAKKYNVHPTTIQKIMNGKLWGRVV